MVDVSSYVRKTRTLERLLDEPSRQQVGWQVGLRETLRKFLDLPKQGEIPKVEQAMLHKLYSDYARGIKNEELLDEVESRFLARMKFYVEIHELSNLVYHEKPIGPWTNQDNVDSDIWFEAGDQLLNYYGMIPSGSYVVVEEATNTMITAQLSRDFDRRMLAVDNAVQLSHDSGPLADSFIEGGEAFLDWLSEHGMTFERG